MSQEVELVEGRLFIPGQNGSGLFCFSGYEPCSEPLRAGAFRIEYSHPRLRCEWAVHADDYPVEPLWSLLERGAATHSLKRSERWINPMADIRVQLRSDGLGHFTLAVEDAERDQPRFARATIELDTATLTRASQLLRAFMSTSMPPR